MTSVKKRDFIALVEQGHFASAATSAGAEYWHPNSRSWPQLQATLQNAGYARVIGATIHLREGGNQL